ncbi:MAG TPA: hypothetical protein VMD75_18505 [Candidatus Binataceae bacterium]|nr:hypothetical protein [Candidatus Binataceae bacterium]
MIAAAGLAAGLTLTLWSCETLSNYLEPTPEATLPPTQISPAAISSPATTPEAIASPVAESTPRRHAHPSHLAAGESSPVGVQTPSGSAPTITLDNDQAARQQAQGLLDSANSKLGKVDRTKLSRDDAATYAQAMGFADAAQQAIGQHDYVAASGLAEKASLLADKVAPEASATPIQTGF